MELAGRLARAKLRGTMADTDMHSREILLRNVRARLELADEVWRSQASGRIAEALRGCDEGLAELAGLAKSADGKANPAAGEALRERQERARWEAALWLKRGHLLELRAATDGLADALIEALRGYERAIACLADTATDEGRAVLAGAWLNRGNVLQRLGTEASGAEAVRCYDRSIALLEALPEATAEDVVARRLPLGAAWLNRGVALIGVAGVAAKAEAKTKTPEAARSFERAITELASLAETHVSARRSLASAWTNLGLARVEKEPRAAVTALERALAISGTESGENDRAAMRLNLAQARRAAGDPAAALVALREIVSAVSEREAGDAPAADIGLRARHAVCVILGEQLAAEGDTVTDATAGLLTEALGQVESGLGFIRSQDAARAGGFGETGARLYEFGAWLYRSYGEAGLTRYLLTWLEPADAGRIGIARRAVGMARQEIMQRGFEQLVGDAAGEVAVQLAGLRGVEEHLGARERELAAAGGRGGRVRAQVAAQTGVPMVSTEDHDQARARELERAQMRTRMG